MALSEETKRKLNEARSTTLGGGEASRPSSLSDDTKAKLDAAKGDLFTKAPEQTERENAVAFADQFGELKKRYEQQRNLTAMRESLGLPDINTFSPEERKQAQEMGEYMRGQQASQVIEDFAEKHPVTGTVMGSIGSLGGATEYFKALKEGMQGGRYTGYDSYNGGSVIVPSPTRISQAATSGATKASARNLANVVRTVNNTIPFFETDEEAEAWGSKLGEDVQSVITSQIQSLAVGSTLGKYGALLLGGSAASSAYLEAIDRGDSVRNALLHGAASGVAEAAAEYLPLDNLTKIMRGGKKPLVQTLTALLQQTITEGLEEGATDLASTIADSLIYMTPEELDKAVAVELAAGKGNVKAYADALSNVVFKGLSDIDLAEVGRDMALGAVGGLLGGGVATIGGRIAADATDISTGAALRNSGVTPQSLANAAKATGAETKTAEKMSKRQMGKAYREISNANTRTAIEVRLAQNGVSDPKAVADIIVKAVRDEESLTSEERRTLENPGVKQVLEDVKEYASSPSDSSWLASAGQATDFSVRFGLNRDENRETIEALQRITNEGSTLDSVTQEFRTEEMAATANEVGVSADDIAEAYGKRENEGISLERYATVLKMAYAYGQSARPLQEWATTTGLSTDDAVNKAYENGQKAYLEKGRGEIARVKASSAKVKYMSQTSLDRINPKFSAVDVKSMNSAQKAFAAFLNKVVAPRIHRTIYLFDGADVKTNGWNDSTGIYININAKNGTRTFDMLGTFLHEFGHEIRIESSELFAELTQIVVDNWYRGDRGSFDAAVQAKIAARKETVDKYGEGDYIDEPQAVEEIVCESLSKLAEHPEDVEKIFVGHETLAQRALTYLKKILDAVKQAIASITGKSNMYAEMMDTEALEKAVDVLSRYVEQINQKVNQTTETAETTEAEAKEQYLETHRMYNIQYNEQHTEDLKKNYDAKNASVSLADLLRRRNAIIDIWNEIGGELNSEFLKAWNEKDYKNRAFTIFKEQMGYKYAGELASMCKKGIPLFEAIDSIVREGVIDRLNSKRLGPGEKAVLYDILKSEGFEIPCAICYVEQARRGEARIISNFVVGDGDVKLGWNQVLDDVEKRMAKAGIDYKFPTAPDSIMTEVYAPVDTNMDERTQTAFYEALREACNEEILAVNERIKNDKHKKKKNYRSLLQGTSPKEVAKVLGGTLPSNLKIFKVLFQNVDARFRLVEKHLYNSQTTLNLSAHHNNLYSLFNSQGGTSGYKTKQGAVVYAGDILSKKWDSSDMREELGLRSQSNSDFLMYTLVDKMQMLIDLSAKGYYAHEYTKVPSNVQLFGLSGAKMLMSCIPMVHRYYNADGTVDVEKTMENAGLDENGNPIYDNVEGINKDFAFMIAQDKNYSKNVGINCIGYSDKHIIALLNTPFISQIIGFHDKTNDPNKRYVGAKYAKNYNGINEAVNAAGKTVHLSFSRFLIEAEKELQTNPNTDVPRRAAALYLEYCKSHNYSPAYNIPGIVDHPNYYRLLCDFNCYDSEGNYAPHNRVAFDMPMTVPTLDANGNKVMISSKEVIRSELRKEVNMRESLAEKMPRIMDKFVEVANSLGTPTKETVQSAEGGGDTSYSTQDEEYLALAKDPKGNAKRLREMLEDAAKRRSYNSPLIYHGTTGFGFTQPDTHYSDDRLSFFATDNPRVAKSYSNIEEVRTIAGGTSESEIDNVEEAIQYEADKAAYKAADKLSALSGVRGTFDGDYISSELTKIAKENRGNWLDADIQIHEWIEENIVFPFYNSYADNPYVEKERLDFEGWADSDEAQEIYAITDTLQDTFPFLAEPLRKKDSFGNYSFYANLSGLAEFDAQGSRWNRLADAIGVAQTTRDLAQWCKMHGYKGYILRNVLDYGRFADWTDDEPATIYVFFEPQRQVKSADLVTYDNFGNIIPLSQRFDPENIDIRFSTQDAETAPTFYSQMGKVIEQQKANKFDARSLINMLLGKGVKAEEIKWSGIAAWLDGKKSVTKEELQEFVRGSMLQVEDEWLTNRNWDSNNWEDYDAAESYTYTEARSIIDDMVQFDELKDGKAAQRSLHVDYEDDIFYAYANIDGEEKMILKYNPRERATRWAQYTLPYTRNYRELKLRMPGADYSNKAMEAHWRESGVLAHARVGDVFEEAEPVTDPETGEVHPIFFIEEIQSDWHNAGNKSGYDSPENIQKWRDGVQKLEDLYAIVKDGLDIGKVGLDKFDEDEFTKSVNDILTEMESSLRLENTLGFDLYDEGLYRGRAFSEKSALRSVINALNGEEPAPDAPFKNGKYIEFVMKKLLRTAAEEGYHKIGWTTAKQQSERWSDSYAEGYRIEYDQDIPKFLNRFGKQWGAKASQETLRNGDVIWTFPINEAMRNSVVYEGQPMYSTQDEEYLELAKDPKKNKKKLRAMVDEAAKAAFPNSKLISDGEFRKMWHFTTAQFNSFKPGKSKSPQGIKGMFFAPTNNGSISSRLGDGKEYYLNVTNPKVPGAREHNQYAEKIRKMQEGITDAKEIERINRQFIKETGVDGFVDWMNGWYTVLTPEQIKSADLVTYDDNGNVIPLSQRFNSQSADVRFSTQDEEIPIREGAYPIGEGEYSIRDDMDTRNIIASILLDQIRNQEDKEILRRYLETSNIQRAALDRRDELIEMLRNPGVATAEQLAEAKKELASIRKAIQTREQALNEIETQPRIQTLIRNQYDTIKEYERLVAEEREENQQRIRELRAKMNEKIRAEIDKRIEMRRDLMAKARQQRANDYYIPRIEKAFADMRKNLEKAPEAFRAPFYAFMAAIDFRSLDKNGNVRMTRNEKVDGQKIAVPNEANIRKSELMAALDELAHGDPIKGTRPWYEAYDIIASEDILDWIEDTRTALRKVVALMSGDVIDSNVHSATSDLLKNIYQLARMFNSTIKHLSKAYTNANLDISDVAKQFAQHATELGTRKNNKVGRVEKFLRYDNAQPVTVFDRLGDAGQTLFNLLVKGQNKYAFNYQEILDYAKKWDRKMLRKWTRDVVKVTFGNEEVEMTPAQMISLYLTAKNEDGRRHLLAGGFKLGERRLAREKFKTAYHTIVDATRQITEADIQSLTDTMNQYSPELISMAENISTFLNTTAKRWANQISIARYGYEQFTVADYFPLFSVKSDSVGDIDKFRAKGDVPGSFYGFLNRSFTKERQVNADDALVINDVFDVFTEYVGNVALYNAYALPVLDTARFLGYSKRNEEGDIVWSVSEKLNAAYGQGVMRSYIEGLLDSINGQQYMTNAESLGLTALRIRNRVAVAANFRVILQQPFSIVRAADVISPKYFRPFKFNETREEMKKYSGIALWKGQNNYDADIKMPLKDELVGASTDYGEFVRKATDWGMKGAEFADEMTWAAIWNACKNYVNETNPGLEGQKYFDAVDAKFNEIIYRTQVVDTVLQKSQVMREKNFFAKMVSAFKSEPTTSYNMLLRQYDRLVEAKQKGDTKAVWNIVRGPMLRSMVVFALNGIVNALVTALVDAMRDDDDYETMTEKMREAFFGEYSGTGKGWQQFLRSNLFEGINPLGIPYLADALSFLQGYEPDRVDLIAVEGALTMPATIERLFNTPTFKDAFKVLDAASKISGLPMSNMMRDVVSIWNSTFGTIDHNLKMQTSPESAKSGYEALYKAMTEGKDVRAAQLVDEINDNIGDPNTAYQGVTGIMRDAYTKGDLTRDEARKYLSMAGDYFEIDRTEKQIESRIDDWDKQKQNKQKQN